MTASSIQVFYSNFTEVDVSGTQKLKVLGFAPYGEAGVIYIDPGTYCANTLAEAIDDALVAHSSYPTHRFSFTSDGYYRLYITAGGIAGPWDFHNEFIDIFGQSSTTNFSAASGHDLIKDGMTITLPFGLHEDFKYSYKHKDILVCSSGKVRGFGYDYPTLDTKHGFKFDILTGVEDSFNATIDTVHDRLGGTFPAVISAINAGAKARLYRNWDSDKTAFNDATNTDGYTDFVIKEPGSLAYPYANKTTRRFKLSLEVLEAG